MRPLFAPFFALAVLAAACGEDVEAPAPDRPTIPTATFARVIEELAIARVETLPDTAAYRGRRSEILERHGLSAEDLRRFVAEHGRNDDLMAPIYREMGGRLDTLFQERRLEAAERFPRALPENEPARDGAGGPEPVPADTAPGPPAEATEDGATETPGSAAPADSG